MPQKRTIKKAQEAKRQGKAPSTQASEFVKEQIENIKRGKHGAKNTKQAIAIGLSEARKAGVDLPYPSGKMAPGARDKITKKNVSAKRSKAAVERLKDEPHSSVSHAALSRHAKKVAQSRTKSERSKIAKKAAHTRMAHRRAA